MRYIDVSEWMCLGQPSSVQILNRMMEAQPDLMPHQVAGATGCTLEQAMDFLLFLASQEVADPRLLVYHNVEEHEGVPVASFPLRDGVPRLPFFCEECDLEIDDLSELQFDFLFRIDRTTQLVGRPDAA